MGHFLVGPGLDVHLVRGVRLALLELRGGRAQGHLIGWASLPIVESWNGICIRMMGKL